MGRGTKRHFVTLVRASAVGEYVVKGCNFRMIAKVRV